MKPLTRLLGGEFLNRKLESAYRQEIFPEFARHARMMFVSASVVNPLFLFSDARFYGQSRFTSVLAARFTLEAASLFCLWACRRLRVNGDLLGLCTVWTALMIASAAVLASSHSESALAVTFLMPPVLYLTMPIAFGWRALFGLVCSGVVLAAYMPPGMSMGNVCGLSAGMLLWNTILAIVQGQNAQMRRLQWHAAHMERAAKERLAQSRDALARILASIPAPVMVTQFNSWALLMKNAAADKFFGFELKQETTSVERLFLAADWRRLLMRLAADGQAADFEARVHPKNCRQKNVLLAAVVLNYDGVEALLINFVDITSRKEAESQLSRRANTDALTELPNRRCFFALAGELAQKAACGGEPLAVFMIDIDYFKQINDSYGHDFGDQSLRAFAQLLRSWVSPLDLTARLGGEEFGVVLKAAKAEKAMAQAGRLCSLVATSMADRAGAPMTISIGVANLASGETSIEGALARADQALYAAKRLGRNQSLHFDNLTELERQHKADGAWRGGLRGVCSNVRASDADGATGRLVE